MGVGFNGFTMCACAALLLTGCLGQAPSAGSQRAKTPDKLNTQRLLVLPRPPKISANNATDIAVAKRLIARLSPDDLRRRDGARIVDSNALPWLSGSTEGRNFLGKEPQRILVRGEPTEICPIALAVSAPPTKALEEVAGDALLTCLGQTARKGCGCRIIAVGSVLLVPREDMNYATGIAARVHAPSLGIDRLLVAEDASDGTTLLRDLNGIIGKIERAGDQQIVLTLEGQDTRFSGTSKKVGFRRGRLAERIYARDEKGNKVSLLIGFDPDELAEVAGAWLAFPPDT